MMTSGQRMHQCLIFIVKNERPEYCSNPVNSLNQPEVAGFALFSEAILNKFPNILKNNLGNALQIIDNLQVYPFLNDGVRDDRVEIVEMLLDENVITHASQCTVNSKYLYAERFNSDVVEILLGGKSFVQLEAKFHMNHIPRILSFFKEDRTFMQQLLSLRPDIKYRHSKGGTFLHLAVDRGDEIIVELLLSYGANVAVVRNDGSTALHLAAQKGNLRIVQLLLDAGADFNIKMKDGSTPLHMAVENGHTEIVKLLLTQGAFVNATALSSSCLGGATPLHIAIEKKNTEMVKLLLRKNADVNAEAFFGITVLQLAIEQGSSTIVEHVLSYSPDMQNNNNKRAFRLAVCRNDQEYNVIVKKLLDSGFTVEPADVGNSELLLGGIRKNCLHIVGKLLEFGTHVNEMLGDGFFSATPLHTAARHAQEDMVQLLLDAGADANGMCGRGRTPVEDAFECVNLKALKVFVANNVHNQDDHELFLSAAEEGWIEIIQSLLENSPKITVETIKGRALMFTAARKGHGKLIEFALKHGASINCKDEEDRTPLHEASVFGFPKVAEILLRNSADVDAKCSRGRTPVFDAARFGQTEVVEILLKYGARIDFKDVHGITALHEAAARGCHQCLRTLLEYNFTNPKFISFVYQPDRTLDLAFRHQLMKMLDVEGGFDRSRRRNDLYFGCVEIFSRHAVKTVAANLWTSDIRVIAVKKCKEISVGDCKAEIENMKTDTVGDTNITFHDVFMGNHLRIACYARNCSIVQILTTDDYKRKFPIYANIIRYQFQKGTLRKELLEDGTKVCGVLFNHYAVLPDDVMEKILNYLDNKDLITLTNTFKCDNAMETPCEISQVRNRGFLSWIRVQLVLVLPTFIRKYYVNWQPFSTWLK